MKTEYDLAVLGSGFAGSLVAMIARRLGRSVLLIERGRHPRFAIGESSTPLANLLLEELARAHDLPQLLPLTKWGTWQHAQPAIACGLKRGFTFYHHRFDEPFAEDAGHDRQLLVAASPHDAIADTHWYRPHFDEFCARTAQALGVELTENTIVRAAEFSDAGATLKLEQAGRISQARARFVIDATGLRGCLHQLLRLTETPFAHLPPTQGLYAHFRHVSRWDELHPSVATDAPPYPVDDAAVHHIFDGGWIWVLRFNNGITSAGVAATEARAGELNFADGASAWERLLARLPAVRAPFARAQPVTPFVHARRLSFRSASVTGPRWALLPSAAGFLDPLLSTGFPLTLLGVTRLAGVLAEELGSARFTARLDEYAARTASELATTERLIAALYASLGNFPRFRALSLLYFAAASFTETARRLGRPELAGSSFLLDEHPTFGPEARACCAEAVRLRGGGSPAEQAALLDQIYRAIAPVDVAGLGERDRRNWYPAAAADLRASRHKLGATAAEIERLLARCGFTER